ncbi:lysophospholipid acyltransferase 5-like [Clavelina lepadiformis]|uniref:lysophospholipid acyltransferase 5-like n=1 Tax=Clavelina lepadiformis TaxID=159417 RepID=UPI00404336A7
MLVSTLSEALNVNEAAVKLLLTLYAGYILALIHRRSLFAAPKNHQYLYFILSGIGILYWNYGWDVLHSLLCVVTQWLIFLVLGGSVYAVTTSFVFQLGYLTLGYLYFSTSDYDINWLIPQCVLTLRLIGLAFDVYDGHRNEDDLSSDQKQRAIRDFPSLFELLGYNYLYCGYIVGPQYPLQRARALINGELTDSPGQRPNSVMAGFRRGFSGTVMLGIQTYIDIFFYPQYYTTSEFQGSGFFYKAGYVAIAGHNTLLRYVCIWMINEGACIICGLGYTKDDKTGKAKWDAVRNVTLHKFLLAQSFQDIINCFNVNTNGWVMRYVFKRLRFVGIRTVSHLSALTFLAVWHGLHVGYFTCFAYEFLTMTVEKPFITLLRESSFVKKLKSISVLSWIPSAIGFFYLHSLLGYCMIDFTLLTWDRYQPVHASIYYHGHVFYGTLYVLLTLRTLLVPAEKKTQ